MSIYSISNWSAGTYQLWDIVRRPSNTNLFYYSLTNSNTADPLGSSNWGGISSFNGKVKPKFIWRTNYGNAAEHEPTTSVMKFGDGYEQRVIQNLNNDLLKLNLTFSLRTEKETAAIMHFLTARKAQESFLFTPSQPHDIEKLFVCKQFSETYVYYDNHTIQCRFEETATN